MQLGKLIQDTVDRFTSVGIEDAQSEAVQLLGYHLGLTRSQLFLHSNREIQGQELDQFFDLVRRRTAREPLHYIIGTREFWSMEFFVSPSVLIPRPETEFLLEQVLKTMYTDGYGKGPILDMCTGSGVIAVVLAKEIGAASVVAVDCSFDALQVAVSNIARHDKNREISVVCSNLFSALNPAFRFELIVANPPYIAEPELKNLQPEVREWEPKTALTAGAKGLDIINILADQSARYLVPGGWLFVEIGADQKDAAREIFRSQINSSFDHVEVIDDWAGRPRVLKARKKDNYGQTDH